MIWQVYSVFVTIAKRIIFLSAITCHCFLIIFQQCKDKLSVTRFEKYKSNQVHAPNLRSSKTSWWSCVLAFSNTSLIIFFFFFYPIIFLITPYIMPGLRRCFTKVSYTVFTSKKILILITRRKNDIRWEVCDFYVKLVIILKIPWQLYNVVSSLLVDLNGRIMKLLIFERLGT